MAKFLDCSTQYLGRLTKQGVLARAKDVNGEPIKGPGQYELVATVRAYIKYLRQAARLDAVAESELNAAKLVRLKAQGEAEMLRLRVLKGELHRADDVEAIMNDLLTGIKMRMLAVPSRVARLVLGQTTVARIIDILTAAIEAALGDVMEYRAESFYARNKAYLLANELRLENVVLAGGSNLGESAAVNGGARSDDDDLRVGDDQG
jgi:hypothetical protein